MSQLPTNELFLVPTDFGAISRPMWCLQSNRNQCYFAGPLLQGQDFVTHQLSPLHFLHQWIGQKEGITFVLGQVIIALIAHNLHRDEELDIDTRFTFPKINALLLSIYCVTVIGLQIWSNAVEVQEVRKENFHSWNFR